MSKLYEVAEAALVQRQQLPAEFGPEMLRPAYEGLSLANVAAQAVEWLAPDAPALHPTRSVPAVRPDLLGQPEINATWQQWQGQGPINHVVILLMDALGYDQLKTMMAQGVAANLAKLVEQDENTFFMPLTSVYPSTTTTALTSVATAYTPAQHGVLGTTLYLSEIGSMVDFIGFKPQVAPTNASFLESQLNPDTLLPVPNIYRRLEEAGVQAEIVNFNLFKGSSISRFTSAGSRAGGEFYNGYLTPADGLNQLRRRLETNRQAGRKSFTYAYIPNVDSSAHHYGPLADNYQAELAALDFALHRELIAPLAGQNDTVLMLVADHGQRLVERDKILWADEYPELTRLFMVPLTGEARANYLHIRPGREEEARHFIETNFGENFLVLDKAGVVELGLFATPGQPLGQECDDRSGQLLLIPKNGWMARQVVGQGDHFQKYNGVHGGLSRSEMLIPFLAHRF